MSTAAPTAHDYTTGPPRRHHSLYIDDGNLVLQVENAIFKVHRSFLVKYSTVIRDMFNTPQAGTINEGTDENPIILNGDSAVGWEQLLGSHYDSPSLLGGANSERLLAILPIAHKYCMEVMEEAIMAQLNTVRGTAGFVDLLIASKIIDSKALYEKAIKSLICSNPKPNLEQARRIGLDAYFTIMEELTICRFVGCQQRWLLLKTLADSYGMKRQCPECSKWQ